MAIVTLAASGALVVGCGGGNSGSSPTSPSTSSSPKTPSAALGWRFAPEGLRVMDAGGPATIQVGGTTYLFVNNGKQANVFQTTDGVNLTPAPFDFHLGIANSFAVLPGSAFITDFS